MQIHSQGALPNVLIVEDDVSLQETYPDVLAGIAHVTIAGTIEEAQTRFRESQYSLSAIVVDACVPGNIPNTMPLVREMRAAGFNGPIIATSGTPDYRWNLMAAGCTYQCDKQDVPRLLRTLL